MDSAMFDRLLFFEHARKMSEATYNKNPFDVDNLTRWASALLELAAFHSGEDSKTMIQEAISRLKEALFINPTKHESLWCLGNALASLGLRAPDQHEAKNSFDQASLYYQLAINEDPENEIYRKSLEVAAQGPLLHLQMQKHGVGQQRMEAAGPSTFLGAQGANKNKKSDFIYDLCGWAILAIGVATWFGFSRSRMPPPPPPY